MLARLIVAGRLVDCSCFRRRDQPFVDQPHSFLKLRILGTRLVKVRPFRWRPLVRARPRIERAGQRADGFTLLAALPVVEHTIVVWSLQIAEHGQPPVKLSQNFRVIEMRNGRRAQLGWVGSGVAMAAWHRRPGRGGERAPFTIRTGGFPVGGPNRCMRSRSADRGRGLIRFRCRDHPACSLVRWRTPESASAGCRLSASSVSRPDRFRGTLGQVKARGCFRRRAGPRPSRGTGDCSRAAGQPQPVLARLER